jgi:SAM-dependent methyltransferase
VDRVWKGEPLETLLHDKLDTFDAIIASHVIEHLVDPIGFFNSGSRLLKEDGRIALAVPDKRLCFDCLRPVSTTGQLIATWRSKRRLHSLASVFDHSAYHARRPDGSSSWGRGVRFEPQLFHKLEDTRNVIDHYDEVGVGEYVDVHGWVFTPSSFECLILELHGLGLIDWRVAKLVQRDAVEFIAILEKSATRLSEEAMKERRRVLLVRQLEEARQHADWMLGATSALPVAFVENGLLPAQLERARRSRKLPPSLRGWRRFIDAKTRGLARDYRLVASSPLFDPEWYLRTYPDVATSGMDAAEHYLRFGANEGRDPGPKEHARPWASLG